MKTAILLGSGSSVPAGFPTTQCLTDLVLSGKGVERATDESYHIEKSVRSMAPQTLNSRSTEGCLPMIRSVVSRPLIRMTGREAGSG